MLKHIAISEAKDLIAQQSVTIIDIRDKLSFSLGHIDSARNITQHEIEEFVENHDKEDPILCYCYHGNSSVSAATFLISKGFTTVYTLDGGYEDWKIHT